MTGVRISALNVHAAYACRHSHACCTAGWSIPVEADKVALLGGQWLLPAEDGACPKLDRTAGRCRVHREHGEVALPDSCHHFPRRSLIDGRGISVSLSHFCPTAATLLLGGDGPLEIVEQPPAFPVGRTYEGLEAREEWPPLLRRDVLFDYESFALWERFVVITCGTPSGDVSSTLAAIATAAEHLREWTVDRGPLAEWTTHVLGEHTQRMSTTTALATGTDLSRYAHISGTDAYRAVLDTVPAGLTPPNLPVDLPEADAVWVEPHWAGFTRQVLRFIGAKAFASWTPYQSRGIRTWVAELYLAEAVLRVECARACARAQQPLDCSRLHEAVRMSDWLLVHLADRDALMIWLGAVEHDHV